MCNLDTEAFKQKTRVATGFGRVGVSSFCPLPVYAGCWIAFLRQSLEIEPVLQRRGEPAGWARDELRPRVFLGASAESIAGHWHTLGFR